MLRIVSQTPPALPTPGPGYAPPFPIKPVDLYPQFKEDLDAYARNYRVQRQVLGLPFQTAVSGLVLYGQRVSVGHLRVFAGQTLRDLEVVYDQQIFYSAQSDRASLFINLRARSR